MNEFLLLTKVQLLSLLQARKSKSAAKAKASLAPNAALITLFMFSIFGMALAGFYCFVYGQVFASLGIIDVFPKLLFTLTSSLTVITMAMQTPRQLFVSRDYDTIASLPVRSSSVVASKICILYLYSLFLDAIILIPGGVVYALLSPVSVSGLIFYFVMMFFVPILPLLVSCIIGAIIGFLGSRFKKSNFASIVLYFIFIIGVMVLSFSLSSIGDMTDGEAARRSIYAVTDKMYPLGSMIDKAVNGSDVLSFLIFLAISIVAFVVISAGVGVLYSRLHSVFTAKKTGFKYSYDNRSGGVMRALVKKEYARMFSSAIYTLNSLFGIIFAFIASVAAIVFADKIFLAINDADAASGAAGALWELLYRIAPVLVSFFFTMSAHSSASISIEGKSLYILKSCPVSGKQVFAAKLLPGLLIGIPVALLASLSIGLALRFPAYAILGMAVLVVLFAVFSTVFGLWLNLKFHNFDWTNEAMVTKQSTPVMILVFASMALIGGLVAAVILLPQLDYFSIVGSASVLLMLITALCLIGIFHGAEKKYYYL